MKPEEKFAQDFFQEKVEFAYRGGLLEDEDSPAVPRVQRLDGELVDEVEVLLERVDGERLPDEPPQLLVLVAVGGEQARRPQDLLSGVEQVQAHHAVLPGQQDLGRFPPCHEHCDPTQHVRLEHLAEPDKDQTESQFRTVSGSGFYVADVGNSI